MIVPPTEDNIQAAAAFLADGELVAFPTETVYGLGADATNGIAVARIYEAKGRPAFNPLITHVPDISAAEALGILSGNLQKLAAAFWPGPLTVVADKQRGCPVSELATAGLDTIALRCPDHPIARALLNHLGRPVVGPSANWSGHVSATTAQHVAADLGSSVAMILDGGLSPVGVESTIVGLATDVRCGDNDTKIAILREGGITREQIAEVIGAQAIEKARPQPEEASHAPTAPGQLASHYAPKAKLRLNATQFRNEEAILAFGAGDQSERTSTVSIRNLSVSGDLQEAAANLFRYLRELDETGATAIAAMPVPESGLGAAINDRLRRAAAPRASSENT